MATPTPLNPIQRAALAWLREQGLASADQLRQAMTASGAVTWLMLDQRERFWAEDCLYELYVAGHAQRSRDGGELLYCAADADAAPGAPAVAAPRRSDVMRAPALAGGDDTPVREGALDYAAVPSLINGQRVYRTPL